MVVKMDFDEDGEGASKENSLTSPSSGPAAPAPASGAKPKAPRVKREKKEPGGCCLLLHCGSEGGHGSPAVHDSVKGRLCLVKGPLTRQQVRQAVLEIGL